MRSPVCNGNAICLITTSNLSHRLLGLKLSNHLKLEFPIKAFACLESCCASLQMELCTPIWPDSLSPTSGVFQNKVRGVSKRWAWRALNECCTIVGDSGWGCVTKTFLGGKNTQGKLFELNKSRIDLLYLHPWKSRTMLGGAGSKRARNRGWDKMPLHTVDLGTVAQG